ncbi:bifunctional oligoribonuclease/PAP phosphatase NrnA [Bullifex sp.]|uniref:DHH family phosphoesterase n=1 Tax=Bullifex sp. TaxID=2815808 RepID=UPI002A7FA373|nr:bifunctional oligoribonuclease/PAP phosphatase NrnA [Bullifex sp.]MDY4066173.1 bifunctional oligoribonuclease/PAP phosphatase NrnA [Bullifex sp.]
MNEEIKRQILKEIKSFDSILIARHFRPDGDAIGSTKGLQRILKLTYPDKNIRLCNKDYSDYMAFLGDEDGYVTDEDIKKSLVLILDTATSDRVSDDRVLNGKIVIKIDHHIDNNPYGDISWVEEKRSSTAELIADFYQTFKDELKIDSHAATCIYTGMNTDSGRFRFASTTGETLRLAGLMVDQGVDIETLQAQLDLRYFKFYSYQSDVFSRIKVTENGLAYIFVDLAMQEKWNLSREESSDSVTFLNMIKGSIAWIAFIENPDHTIRVRLRSRFMTINQVAERYHGGGHDRASGATCYTKEEMDALIKDADREVKLYKETHEGWI